MIGLLEGRLAREAARAKAAEARVAELERALEHFMAGGGGGREVRRRASLFHNIGGCAPLLPVSR